MNVKHYGIGFCPTFHTVRSSQHSSEGDLSCDYAGGGSGVAGCSSLRYATKKEGKERVNGGENERNSPMFKKKLR